MIDDAFGDVEIVLPEGAGRVMHGGAAEPLDDGLRTTPSHEIGAEDRIAARDVRVEPQAVQVVAEPLTHQVEAPRERLGTGTVRDQDDLRRLIALTSVSHFGFIILGIFAFTSVSMTGSVLYMFNHGLSTAVLFLVAGMMIARRGSARISDYGGVQKVAPVLSGVLLVGGLSSLSLPGLAPFVSEFLVLVGTFSRSIPM